MVGLKNERKGNLEHEIRYHKFVISREATGLRLTFPFTFFSMKTLQFWRKQNANKKKIKITQKLDENKTDSPLLLLVNTKAKTMKN